MIPFKVRAKIHSLSGEEVEIAVLQDLGNNDYIVEYEGVKCHALFNWFVNCYFVDDVYRRIEE